MSWKDYYQSRIVTADEAAAKIQDGDQISYGHATGEPQLFAPALIKREKELKGVAFVHGLAMGPAYYCDQQLDPECISHSTEDCTRNTAYIHTTNYHTDHGSRSYRKRNRDS